MGTPAEPRALSIASMSPRRVVAGDPPTAPQTRRRVSASRSVSSKVMTFLSTYVVTGVGTVVVFAVAMSGFLVEVSRVQARDVVALFAQFGGQGNGQAEASTEEGDCLADGRFVFHVVGLT